MRFLLPAFVFVTFTATMLACAGVNGSDPRVRELAKDGSPLAKVAVFGDRVFTDVGVFSDRAAR